MSENGTNGTQVTERPQVREVVVERSRDDGIKIPKWRFDEAVQAEREKVRPLEAELSTLRERVSSLDAIEAAKAAAESEAAKWRRLHETDVPLLNLASTMPSLAHEEVRDFFRAQHDAHVARAGDKAQGFTDWLEAQKATPSPLLSPYLTPAQAAAQAAQGQPAARQAAALPSVDAGAAAAAAGTVARYTGEEINHIFRTKPRTSDEYKRAEAQLRADGLIR